MCAFHQRLELLHACRHARSQVGVYIEIVLDGIHRACLALHDGAMVAGNAVGAVVCLRGVLNHTCVPDVRHSQRLDLRQRLGREIIHGAATVHGAVAMRLVNTFVASEQSREDLIDDGFIGHGGGA